MSRVINPNLPGKERNQLKKRTALALRELLKTSEPDARTKDLVAFIVLALEGIQDTVDTAASAWEKKDYWIKADRFRREWEWAGRISQEMRPLVLKQDWDAIAVTAAKIYKYIGDVTLSEHHRMGEPWVGAWVVLTKSES